MPTDTAPHNRGRAEVRAAAALTRDLFTPDPWQYWRELACTGTLAWTAAALAIAGVGGPTGTLVSLVAAVFIWHRATVMVHELAHQRREALPGFHLAWNLVIGIAFMFPSVFYERVHSGHHRRTTYGTAEDPEYLPLAGRPWLVASYLGSSVLLFPLLAFRFLVLAPLSWFIPPLRRLVLRHGSSYVINPGFARSTTAAERRQIFHWEGIIVAVWWPLLFSTALGGLSWRWLIICYGIHTGTSVVNRLRMMTAHEFRSDGQATDLIGQVRDSIDCPRGWWTELWAPLGLRYHALHHLFPTLPFHALGTAYRRLLASLPEDAVYRQSTKPGWLGSTRNLLRPRSDI